MTVRLLGTDQVAEHLAGLGHHTRRQCRASTFYQVPRPHQVIAATTIAGLPPGYREACYQRSGKGTVGMHLEYILGALVEGEHVFGKLPTETTGFLVAVVPLAPGSGIAVADFRKTLGKTRPGVGRGRLFAGAKAQGQGAALG